MRSRPLLVTQGYNPDDLLSLKKHKYIHIPVDGIKGVGVVPPPGPNNLIAQFIPEPLTGGSTSRKIFWIENLQIPDGVTLLDFPTVIKLKFPPGQGANKILSPDGFDAKPYDTLGALMNYKLLDFDNSVSDDFALLRVRLPEAKRYTQIQIGFGDEFASSFWCCCSYIV